MRVRARREFPCAEPDPRPAGTLQVEEAIEQLAVADWVWTAIDRLPGDQAVTVMLRYFTRHTSYQEIAAGSASQSEPSAAVSTKPRTASPTSCCTPLPAPTPTTGL